MPLVVFILLALVLLAILGFACACLTDQPIQALDRVIAALGHVPAVTEVWSLFAPASSALAASVMLLLAARPAGRASPALLQRFLF